MPRLITLWAILLLGIGNCFSQEKTIDSLKNELAKTKVKDSNYVFLLYNIANSLLNKGDLNGSSDYANKGVELANKMSWDRGSVLGYLRLSDLKIDEAKYDSSAEYALTALRISENMHNEEFMTNSYFQLSTGYRLMGNHSLGEYYGVKFLDGANRLKNNQSILSALLNLSHIYRIEGHEEKSQKLLDRALKMPNVKDNKRELARIYETKGTGEELLGNFASAINFYRQGLDLWQQSGDLHWQAYTMTDLSRVYSKMGKKDSASFYAYFALDLGKKNDLKKELGDTYSTLFFLHQTFGDYKKALDYRLLYDSMYYESYNLQTAQNSERTRLKFEQEKKDILTKREQEIKNNATRKTRNLQYGIIGGFMLLAIFLFWNNRQKQKSNRKIEIAYNELRATQSQLIQSEKMASLGELTAGIAHEIQNPLNFVNNFSDVNKELLEELKDEADKGNIDALKLIANDIIGNEQKINQHGKRADAIVKGMLQHSRRSSGVKEPIDINALAEEYLRLSYHGVRGGDNSFHATLQTDFDKSIKAIPIIPQDIGRVLLNLYTNAFYAVSEKSKQQPVGYEAIVSVSTKRINGKIEIRVKDNGNGIPSTVLDKIFQPFFTTKPTGQGTGLGLSLAYDIVKAHSGELRVQTKEREGSEFLIQLPLSS